MDTDDETAADRQQRVQTPLLEPPPSPPKPKPKSVLLSVCSFILITEFCTRMSYYGLAGSLVLLFQSELGYANSVADNQYSVWSGLCYVTPLLGGWLADTYLGRFRCIAIFSTIYCLGLCLLIAGVWPGGGGAGGASATALIFPAIYVVALGDGGIKPNVCTFGADQFNPAIPEQKKELESFFGYFYAAINVGALISFTLIASIAQFGVKGLGGREYRFVVGFAIPLMAIAAAILVFLSGSRRYKKQPPSKSSILATSVRVMWEAAWAPYRRRGQALPPSTASSSSSSWLDRAKRQHGGSYSEHDVEGVKYVVRLLPFLFFLIPYWGIYNQMSTGMQAQGCQMDLHLGSTKVAVSSLNLFDTLAIVLLIPVFDRVIYPFFQRKGYPLSPLAKFGAGFGFAVLAMVASGVLELYRKKHAPEEFPYPRGDSAADADALRYLQEHISNCKRLDDFSPFKYQEWYAAGGPQDPSSAPPAGCRQVGPALLDGSLPLDSIVCDNVPLIAPVSVFWQSIQFLLIGVSEILTSVTSYEFFYSQAPSYMRSFTQSLNLLTTALGVWLCVPLVALGNVNPDHQMIPSNLNQGYLAEFFFLLAAIMAVDLAAFAWLSRGYEYVEIREEEEEGEAGASEPIHVVGQDEESLLLHMHEPVEGN